MTEFIFAWGNNSRRAELKGRKCRVLARGTMGTVLIKFANGEKVTTSYRALRKRNLDALEWRAIPGYEGRYEISEEGDVRAIYATKCGHPIGRIRAPRENARGYSSMTLLSEDRTPRQFTLHHLVLLAFVGPRPDGMVTRHLDGNPRNNSVGNLAWGTPVENMADRAAHGHTTHGEEHWSAKLTEGEVALIRTRLARGDRQIDIAADFGIKQPNVSKIKLRQSWK
jgi:hypothetical protein